MKTLLSILLLSISRLALAQTISISGTVRDKQGDPLHFAFVQDKQDKYAVYTDSLGNFTLTVKPDAKFHLNCFGYKDTVISVNNQTTFTIVLSEIVKVYSSNQEVANTDGINMATFRDEINSTPEGTLASQRPVTVSVAGGKTLSVAPETVDMAQGAIFPVFAQKEATVGSRFMFKEWEHGYVVNAKDSLIQNPGFWFNYDKMGGAFLLSKDRHAAIEVNKENIKSFTLYDNANIPYTFERVPEINASHYVQVLAAGNKYKIYKLINTKLVKANYATDGIMSTGKDYDEYVNDGDYYVYTVQNNQLQKLSLKKKAIKEAFAKDTDKLNKFMADHSDDTIDDTYLSTLGAYMNE